MGKWKSTNVTPIDIEGLFDRAENIETSLQFQYIWSWSMQIINTSINLWNGAVVQMFQDGK